MSGLYKLAIGPPKKGGLSVVLQHRFLELETILADFAF